MKILASMSQLIHIEVYSGLPTFLLNLICSCPVSTNYGVYPGGHTKCYVDNTLIIGATQEAHLKNLEEVLHRLQLYGVRVESSKCEYSETQLNT